MDHVWHRKRVGCLTLAHKYNCTRSVLTRTLFFSRQYNRNLLHYNREATLSTSLLCSCYYWGLKYIEIVHKQISNLTMFGTSVLIANTSRWNGHQDIEDRNVVWLAVAIVCYQTARPRGRWRRRRPGTSWRRAGCRSAASTSATGATATSSCSTMATWWGSRRSPSGTTTATRSTSSRCATARSWLWTSRAPTPSPFAACSGPPSSSATSPSTLRRNGQSNTT